MKDSIDTRDTGPRAWSPLWIYLCGVTAAGLVAVALVLAGAGARPETIAALLLDPLFWVMAVLVLVGELRPVITPGSQAAGSATASTMFAFAALLFYGLPVALVLHMVAMLVCGVVTRKAWFRIAFNMAQHSLAFMAAAVVLSIWGPARPVAPSGSDLIAILLAAAAYFVVTHLLVCGAITLHERRSFLRVIRSTTGYQSVAHATLLGMAPLVVVAMAHSAALVPLFLAPLVALHLTATMSMRRDHQAMHDSLTGLPNRKMLVLRTEQAIADADERLSLLLLDLDRFKEVNDTLGHPVGDRLLQMIAHRFIHSVRPGDVVARLGGDEFAILLPAIRDEQAAREVAARLRAALSEPVRLEGMTFDLEASVGIALYPDHAPDFELLMQRADVAMYVAKENGRGVEVYSAAKDRNSPARLSLMSDLRQGIDRGELFLHFQPKVLLESGRATGMEALVRWHHPQRGLVSPADFVPLAEQSDVICALTTHVVAEAARQAARWWDADLPVPVSVNVSARNLLDSGLADVIEEALRKNGLPPEALQLEVTERVLITDQAYTAETVRAISEIGVPLALDDFGTGHSSLVRLQRLRVHEVKIDSSFVKRVTTSVDDAVIVRSIVELVGSLGMRAVAEGIEDSCTAAAVQEMGCEAGQGWWICEALPADDATEWLRRNLKETALPAMDTSPALGSL